MTNDLATQLWRRMKEVLGARRCFEDLPQLYQRTRQVLMAHQERPIYEFGRVAPGDG